MARFDGTHITVAEFLLEEVLDRLPPDERTFLLRCSITPVLGAGLAEALTGRNDAPDVLERLAAEGVFVTRTQEGEAEFRFHPMLADLLRHELPRLEPERLRAQHLHAAEWYLATDRPVEAVEHLLAAQEYSAPTCWCSTTSSICTAGTIGWISPDGSGPCPTTSSGIPGSGVAALSSARVLAEPGARQWYRHCDALVPRTTMPGGPNC